MYQFSFIQLDSNGDIENSISFIMEKSHPLSSEEEILVFQELKEQNEIDHAVFTTHKTQSIGAPFNS